MAPSPHPSFICAHRSMAPASCADWVIPDTGPGFASRAADGAGVGGERVTGFAAGVAQPLLLEDVAARVQSHQGSWECPGRVDHQRLVLGSYLGGHGKDQAVGGPVAFPRS